MTTIKEMKIETIKISDIVPYEKNPRNNDAAVEVVAKSIKEYGFYVPIILDKNNVIIAGHTRLKAAIKLGMTQVPVIYADNLNEKQINAFRIMENKSSEYASWDIEKLQIELNGLDLNITGFNKAQLSKLMGPKTSITKPKEIILIQIENDTHDEKIRKILKMTENQKTIESDKFIECISL